MSKIRRLLPSALLACGLWTSLGAATSASAAAQSDRDTLIAGMNAHPLLGRLGGEVLQQWGSFLVIYQRPRKANPEIKIQLSEQYEAWLTALDDAFHGDIIMAAGISEPSSSPLVPLFIADGNATFKNVNRYAQRPRHFASRIAWFKDPGMLITLRDPSDASRPSGSIISPVLFGLTRHLFEAWCQRSYPGPEESWMVDGLAGYYSCDGTEDPAELASPPVNAAALAWYKGLKPGQLKHLVVDLHTLISMGDRPTRHEELSSRARKAGGGTISEFQTSAMWYHQTALWMHFLLRGDSGKWRTQTIDYMGRVLRGKRGPVAFKEALGLDRVAELDAPFKAHLEALARGEGIGAGPPPERRVVASSGRTLYTPGLAANPEDPNSRMDLAMARAARGAIGAAAKEMQEISRSTLIESFKFEVQAEYERMEIAVFGRDKFLNALVKSGKKLAFVREGKKIKVKLIAYEHGVLNYELKRGAEPTLLAADEIRPDQIAMAMGRDAGKYGPSWMRGYLLAIGGDSKWKRFVDTKTSSGKALANNIEGPIARWVEAGNATLALDDLAYIPPPTNAAEGKQTLETVEAVLKKYGETPALIQVKQHLRALTAEALAPLFAQEGVLGLVNGKITRLKDGRIKLSYDFKKPDQAKDFKPDDSYMAIWRSTRGKLSDEAKKEGFSIRGGQFTGRGARVYRLPIPFDAPTIRYRLIYGRASGKEKASANISVGFCDDGKGSYIAVHDVYDLEVLDQVVTPPFVQAAFEEGKRDTKYAKPYEVEIRHDGKETVFLKINGKEVRKIRCGKRVTGDIFLWMHASSPIALLNLEIEGVPNLDGRGEELAAWVEEQLIDMGF